MKKIYLFLGLLTSAFILNAQVFSFTRINNESGDEEDFTEGFVVNLIEESGISTDFVHITNTTQENITFKIRKNIQQITDGNQMLMCFGEQCLGGDESDFQTVNAGETFTNFDIQYIYINTTTSNAIFSIINQEGETLQSFNVTYTGNNPIKEVAKEVPLTLSAKPIPANTNVTLLYSVPAKYTNAKIIVRNTLGSIIRSFNVETAKNGKINLNVSDFQSGVYFYSIVADGNVLSTKKLVVKH
ncbi:MAG: T9SS type A sorting domain-containing protein [Bacteroidales bacterium]|nr:T9SS type A sorting domain-containing protein [Bacteroidales bacterium]